MDDHAAPGGVVVQESDGLDPQVAPGKDFLYYQSTGMAGAYEHGGHRVLRISLKTPATARSQPHAGRHSNAEEKEQAQEPVDQNDAKRQSPMAGLE